MCQAVRAPGSKVTWPPLTRPDPEPEKEDPRGPVPVNQSEEPFVERARAISFDIDFHDLRSFARSNFAAPAAVSTPSITAAKPAAVRRWPVDASTSTSLPAGRFSMTSLMTGAAENAFGQPA